MRHRKSTVKLGRTSAHRDALLASLVCNLIDARRIKTTLPKAKAARTLAEKMVTLGKKRKLPFLILAGAWIPRPVDSTPLFHTPVAEIWRRSLPDLGENPSAELARCHHRHVAEGRDARVPPEDQGAAHGAPPTRSTARPMRPSRKPGTTMPRTAAQASSASGGSTATSCSRVWAGRGAR